MEQTGKDTPKEVNSKESSRHKILAVAARLFSEKGYEGVSVREITEACDSNISMISYYFGSKEGLYQAVIREFGLQIKTDFEILVQKYRAVEVNRDSFLNFISSFVKRIIQCRQDSPDIFQILELERVQGHPHNVEVIQEVFIPITLVFHQIIEDAQTKGLVDKQVSPHFVFVSLLEGVKGVLCHIDCRKKFGDTGVVMPETPEEIRQQFMILFTKGLLI